VLERGCTSWAFLGRVGIAGIAERLHMSSVTTRDTPHDIKGAHDNGAVAVGVATGGSSAEN
jgi:phosphoglycolate phosphatase-like HAD superfamily hydrolase